MSGLNGESQQQDGHESEEELAMSYRYFLGPLDTQLVPLPADAVAKDPLLPAAAAHLQAWCLAEDTTFLLRPMTLLQLKFRTGYKGALGIVQLLETHGVLSELIDGPAPEG